MSTLWTEPADIVRRVRRSWDNGSLLRAYADRQPFTPIGLPIRGPRPSQIGDDLTAVREWIVRLDAGRRDDRRYLLDWSDVGGRSIGRNRLPSRARVTSWDQAWTLLGVSAEVRRYDAALLTAEAAPAVRAWVGAHPLRALEIANDLQGIVAAYEWLQANRDSGSYLRVITAPGVDTKFAERHRAVLAQILGVSGTSIGFLRGLGLRTKPEFVRIRPAPSLGLPAQLSELAVRREELVRLDIAPTRAVVVENEISYLSVEVPPDGIVLWGKGFDVDQVGRLPWLVGVDLTYWGDIDTHGFAILDRLRAWLPQSRSVLMDRETLLRHRDRWVREERPTSAALTRLNAAEAQLYGDLVTDSLGHGVRLEQERIDWEWAQRALHSADSPRPRSYS